MARVRGSGVNLAHIRSPLTEESRTDLLLRRWHGSRFFEAENGLSGGFELPTGTRYVGDMKDDGTAHGAGRYSNMATELDYHGEVSNGHFHGEGKLKFQGCVQEGSWMLGELVSGTARLPDGMRYTGKPTSTSWSGNCRVEYPGGDVYEGALKAGMPHGIGIRTLPSGTSYKGNFKNGHREGTGRMILASGENLQGNFKHGSLNGAGTVRYADGSIATGDFTHGKLNGRGKYTFSNGVEYEGDFRQGQMHGPDGKLTYQAQDGRGIPGFRYDGAMVLDKPSGEGMVSLEHIRYTGNWKDGELHGKATMIEAIGKGKHTGRYRPVKNVNFTHGARDDIWTGTPTEATFGAAGDLEQPVRKAA